MELMSHNPWIEEAIKAARANALHPSCADLVGDEFRNEWDRAGCRGSAEGGGTRPP